jgi:hypothetical protein
VSSLKSSMREVSKNLRQFKIENQRFSGQAPAEIEDLKHIKSAKKILGEEEMTALESTEETRASV